jgi:hypothetical protein
MLFYCNASVTVTHGCDSVAIFTDAGDMMGTVDNVASESPPDVGSDIGPTSCTGGNAYLTVRNTAGRTYSLGVHVKF